MLIEGLTAMSRIVLVEIVQQIEQNLNVLHRQPLFDARHIDETVTNFLQAPTYRSISQEDES